MNIKTLIVGDIRTNCYLLESEGELAIVDPGGGVNLILEEIKRLKAKPKYIINTHYHFDHTIANNEIKLTCGSKILIHQAERGFKKFGANFKADKFLQNNDKINIGAVELKVIHTPGHTKGSICLLDNLDNSRFIFTGDTLFKDGCGRTDLEGGSLEEMEESLAKLKNILKPSITVYPGHGESFTV